MKLMKAKKWMGILSVALVAGILTVGCGVKEDASEEKKAATETDKAENKVEISGKHHVEISVKDYGTIKVELDADTAPITVENFMTLAEDGFYDGLTFHRIIDGFMIQGGDPNGNGMGGSDTKIKGEFKSNGVENDISHVRGTISMARSKDYDSASSQFFIVQSDSLYLDGEYAGFGTVTEGMEIVDQICKDTPVQDSNGTVSAEDQPVIESVKVID
ncbi:MAG: peptidylprolyl isomerase [Bariatricus sp.]